MHWTHRLYPYGPFWLVITVPLSFVGFNVFLINFFLFKFIATLFYAGSVFLIYKINKRINPGSEILNTVLFAFNPLVIIECLVSSHNDIVMVFFALLGIYFYTMNKKILGFIIILLSSQIKIPTVALLAPAIIGFIPTKRFKFGPKEFILASVAVMTLIFFAALTKYEIQPWYILWVFPFIALLKPNKYLISLIFGISIGLLLRYTVFLYSGNWDGNLVLVRNGLTVLSVLIFLIVGFAWSKKKDII
jgi:Gpi18-like mannosyltransferase